MLHNTDDIEELASLDLMPTSLSTPGIYPILFLYRTYLINYINWETNISLYLSSLYFCIRIISLCVYIIWNIFCMLKIMLQIGASTILLSDLQPPHCQREPLSHALMAAAKAMRFGSSRRPSTGDASTTATRIRKSQASQIVLANIIFKNTHTFLSSSTFSIIELTCAQELKSPS